MRRNRWLGLSAKTLTEAISLIEPGMTVFIHGTATEPRTLCSALSESPNRLADVHVITSFIPGINTVSLSGIASGQRYTTFMATATDASGAGQHEALRLPYSALNDFVENLPQLDLAFVPGRITASGRISTGITGELIPMTTQRADCTVLIDNLEMPVPAAGCSLESVDHVCGVSAPLIEYLPGARTDSVTTEIASRVAELVPDGATIQAGLGVIPSAVFSALCQRRRLRVFSGMISDATIALAESGALDANAEHVYGMAMGSQRFYAWLDRRPGFRVAACDETHSRKLLASLPQFFAMNSAVEVALDGSVNAEQLGAKKISGPGGLPDYAFGGSNSVGGASIVALPASNRKRGLSRIVAKLANHEAPTLEAGLTTHVVTEFGVADLRTDDLKLRAERLISIADPDHRASLRKAVSDCG
ncbi:MAG: acetyl-CoA hydrolase/transferase C-terminal domain-containing protein [Pseudomonadota bacterium]